MKKHAPIKAPACPLSKTRRACLASGHTISTEGRPEFLSPAAIAREKEILAEFDRLRIELREVRGNFHAALDILREVEKLQRERMALYEGGVK